MSDAAVPGKCPPDQALPSGLDSRTAMYRLAEAGPNEIERPRSRTLGIIIRETMREPMFLLLAAASGVYLLVGDIGEGVFLICAAALTIGLVVAQEARSENALKALRALAQPSALVIRDGMIRRIPARELVPGDIMLLSEGERIPADGCLVGGDVLSIDESLLTGESAPIDRRPAAGDSGESRVFAGTMVVRGTGRALVQETGPRTRFGAIGATLAQGGEELTPLQKTARRLVAYLAIAALVFCVVVFIAYGLLRHDWLQGGLTALTVAISLLPEEFPMVLAVFLALGAWRLARRNVLVRRAAVIEALGGATILCVDKTGTLTRNQMKLVRLWRLGEFHDLSSISTIAPSARPLLDAAVLASAVRAVDPMDRAVHELLTSSPGLEEPARTWPLRPERLAVIQVWRRDGGEIAAAKGAPETIFRMCALGNDELIRLREVIEAMARDGLRVLGVASARYTASFPDDPASAVFAFEGFLGFLDPVRDDVPAALQEARSAHMAVAMITGDHPATALAIARQAGIDSAGGVLLGEDVSRLDAAALRERVASVRVFARIAPEQKLRLVEALKANGEVVVMTGDGVNDGPALQAANIGIAMGRRGSDVAREAADIVLLDDSFASIVGGVRLGRRIFANLRKALIFVTAVHVPLAGLALIPILLGWPPLFMPMHVVLLELVIDPACSLVFEAEASEADAMTRPPRNPREPLFGVRQVSLAVLQGLVVLAAITVYFGWVLEAVPEDEARGAAFSALVTSSLVLALANSAGGRFGLFERSHTAFWIIAGAATLVLTAILYVPALAGVLHVAPPDWQVLASGLATGILAGGWWGVAKTFRPRLAAQRAV
ncbi:MAG TPA: cation-translocating P-type ATPase [Hyphomonadaceae bacterium]|nr:cation-translocating P-type ATPase [Hyphomonadaceae bacterium]